MGEEDKLEKKQQTLEKERPDEMEMAKKEDEEGKETKSKTINLNHRF